MNKHWFFGLSLLVIFSMLLAGCGMQPTAEEIVAKLREVEASTEDAHGVVEISVNGQGMDEELVIEAWEKKPNMFRAKVLEASDSELVGSISVTDGNQFWGYHPGENEVLVGEVGSEEPASAREMIQYVDEIVQRVLDSSDVKLLGSEDVAGVATYKLELTPKEGEETFLPTGGKVTLWVDQDRWIVLQAHVTGELVGEASMTVRSFELNTGLSDDLFQFEVPEGVQVTNVEDKQPESITLDQAQAQTDFDLLLPTYLPDGTTLVDVLAVEGAIILRYNHTETSFTIVQGLPIGQMPAPPGSQKAEVTVRGQTGNLISDGGPANLLNWTEDGVVITIAGQISEDEILKVADSLQ